MTNSPPATRQRSWSIGTHLVVLALVPMLFALLTTAVVIGCLDVNAIRRTKAEQLLIQSEMVAFNAAAAVAAHDETTAQRQLAALKAQSDVRMGCLLDRDGRVVARFSTIGLPPGAPTLPPWTGFRQLSGNIVAVVTPVIHRGETVGHVYVLAEMDDARNAVTRYVLVLLLVVLGAVSLAWWFANRLQRKIALPISRLADVARKVSHEDNYAVRAPLAGPTEACELAGTFNQMLDEVSTSRASLQAAAEQLEAKVEERTHQLSNEIQLRKRVEVDLRESKAAADAANEAKSTFVANMSHEIRTPLNGILGFTKLLLAEGSGVDALTRQDFLQTIDRSGEQLLALINDVLDLSKVEAGKLNVESVACQPVQIVNDVVRLCRLRAQEKGLALDHRIECELPPDLNDWLTSQGLPRLASGGVPTSILSDPLRLRQIVTNLVSNAIKFSSTGAVTIASRLTMEDAAPRLEIAVRDNGIGIPADKCEAIFQPFVQADSSTTRKFGGTGLGLAISRRFAEALGGTLTVISEVGAGSTFCLRLPIGSLEEAQLLRDSALAERGHCDAEDSCFTRLSGRVLVVDDGETNRKLAKAVLSRCGVTVEQAENGAEALELVSSNSFDVILMDVQMPVMDGHTATARMRAQGLNTPIIAITAAALAGDLEKCLSAGCTDYLTKPFTPMELVEKVSRYLSSDPTSSPAVLDFTPTPAAPLVTERLVSQLPMDDPVFRDVVRQFIDTLAERLPRLEAAVREQAWADVRMEAHWLRGAAGTVGFPQFTAPAGALSAAAKQEDVAGADEHLASLQQLASCLACPA